jgi:hypothetical protein
MSCAKLAYARVFAFITFLMLSFSNICSSGQEISHHENVLRLLRTDFETYSAYQDDPIAQVHIPCRSTNWSVLAEWGDGTPPEALSHAVLADEHASTPSGAYALYSSHRYKEHGRFVAALKLLADCSDRLNKIESQETYHIEVFDHVPIEKFVSESSTVRRGSPLVLILGLTTAAPKSGTRVAFQTSAPPGVFSPDAVPRIVSIPPNADHITLRIPTLKTAAPGTVTLTVVGIDGPHSLQIKII